MAEAVGDEDAAAEVEQHRQHHVLPLLLAVLRVAGKCSIETLCLGPCAHEKKNEYSLAHSSGKALKILMLIIVISAYICISTLSAQVLSKSFRFRHCSPLRYHIVETPLSTLTMVPFSLPRIHSLEFVCEHEGQEPEEAAQGHDQPGAGEFGPRGVHDSV